MSASFTSTALILAGGLGTRLREVVKNVPKPLAPVGGRPFLEYLLEYWISQGIDHFVISTGYLGGLVKRHFGMSFQGAAITYSQEEKPLGTGGAVAKAMGLPEIGREEWVLLLNGDTWFEASLEMLQKAMQLCPAAAACLALRQVKENTRYGGAHLAPDGRIDSFGERASSSNLINAGCCLLIPQRMAIQLDGYPDVFSLEDEAFPMLAEKGVLAGSVEEGIFIDIGVPPDYELFQKYMKSRSSKRDPFL